jgi:hypothetical protein
MLSKPSNVILALLCLGGIGHGADQPPLQEVKDWGGKGNPPKLTMHIYVPPTLPEKPAVVSVVSPALRSTDLFRQANTGQQQAPSLRRIVE